MTPRWDERLEDIIGVPEAAEILGISATMVKRMCDDGQILCGKIGPHWIFRRKVIERMWEERAALAAIRAARSGQRSE